MLKFCHQQQDASKLLMTEFQSYWGITVLGGGRGGGDEGCQYSSWPWDICSITSIKEYLDYCANIWQFTHWGKKYLGWKRNGPFDSFFDSIIYNESTCMQIQQILDRFHWWPLTIALVVMWPVDYTVTNQSHGARHWQPRSANVFS